MLEKPSANSTCSSLLRNTADDARWMRIAQSLLAAASSHRSATPRRRFVDSDELAQAFVRVLERPTPKTAWILWRNAGRCHYGEQMWIRGNATVAGQCALSGQPVKRGDRIYRPRQGKVRTLNALAVILASSVELMPARQDNCR
ncbi:DUF3331 domain-containing protein [Caballeronia sordidicola]|uniref:DUF3331 domain-containing protein n=1 Tax=Caballeronia sordidicola TaxID=196367 RepID=UPI000B77363D